MGPRCLIGLFLCFISESIAGITFTFAPTPTPIPSSAPTTTPTWGGHFFPIEFSWTRLSSGPNQAVAAVAASSTFARLYLALPDVAGVTPGGYFFSSDHGQSFSGADSFTLGLGTGTISGDFHGVACSNNGSVVVLYTGSTGVFFSTDGGINFQKSAGIKDGEAFYGLATSFDGKLVAVTEPYYSSAVYVSSDFGRTFTSVSIPNLVLYHDTANLAVSKSGAVVTLAGTDGQSCVYTSTDFGNSFLPSYNSPNNDFADALALAMSGSCQHQVFDDGGALFASEDCGKSWSAAANRPWSSRPDYIRSSATGELFFANSGGELFYSTNYGHQWGDLPLVAGFQISDFVINDNGTSIFALSTTGNLYFAAAGPSAVPTSAPTAPSPKPMARPTAVPTPKPTSVTTPGSHATPNVSQSPAPTASPTPAQLLGANSPSFVLSHVTVLVYPIALAVSLGAGAAVAFQRRGPCQDFCLEPLSTFDIVSSITIAVMQAVSNVMQLVDVQAHSQNAVICIVVVRLIMASVTIWIVFSALYRKSLSRFVVGACFHNATVWVVIAALALLDPSILRFFCWKHSELAKRSGGFPTMTVFYATLFSTAAASLIMTTLSAVDYLDSYQGQMSLVVSLLAFIVAMTTIVFRLRAEKIHKIEVFIVDSEGLVVVREDGLVFDFATNCRIADKERAAEATHKELARQKEEAAERQAALEREIRELREERARMAQNIVKRASKTSEEAAATAAAAIAAAAAEEKRAFTTNVPFADENLDVLKDQIKQFGKQPLEYIPLDVLQGELDSVVAKVNAGEKYDERRLEHLLACLEINPQYKEEKEAERKAWKARIAPFCANCLVQQRDYTPPHIFSSSFFSLCDEGLSVALAKRLMSKPCLWLVRMKQADILKLHEVELTNRYGSDGHGLDLVELAAIFACLPTERGFPNDPSGRKAAYMSRIEDSLKATLTAHDKGNLPQPKQRAACYDGALPIYEHRQSMLERFITGTTDTLESLRGSFSLSLSISLRLSTGGGNGGGERRSENPWQKWRERDVEIQSAPPRQGQDGSRPLRRDTAKHQQGANVDDIPNPVIAAAAKSSASGKGRSGSGELYQQRRLSVKALEEAFAKNL